MVVVSRRRQDAGLPRDADAVRDHGLGLNWELWWEKVKRSDWLISVSYVLGVDRRRVMLALRPAIELALAGLREQLQNHCNDRGSALDYDALKAGLYGTGRALIDWGSSQEPLDWKKPDREALDRILSIFGRYGTAGPGIAALQRLALIAEDDPAANDRTQTGGSDAITRTLWDIATVAQDTNQPEDLVGLAHARRSIRRIDVNLALAAIQLGRAEDFD